MWKIFHIRERGLKARQVGLCSALSLLDRSIRGRGSTAERIMAIDGGA